MRIPFMLLPLLFSGALVAQELPSVKDQAKQYVDLLAGPTMHGRGYVQAGDSLAAEWIAAQFERIGLDKLNDKRFEPFTFPVNSFPDSISLSVDGTLLKPGIDYLLDPASGPANGKYELVYLGVSDLASPERKALTMGVVMGHAAVLNFPHTTNADSLAMYSDWESELARTVPVFRIGGEKLTWSVAGTQTRNAVIEMRAGVLSDSARTATIHVQNRFIAKHTARNVFGVAKAKGGSKDWLMVTAHYDHLGMMGQALFPGANDNASGVSMLLSLAEYFKKHPPRTNILFVAFAGEEAGLKGSQWFVAD
ncbi:MAG: M28 family peptidase, partial [Flavobacteriales bacterium]